MSKNIEIEIRANLTKEEYELIVHHFSNLTGYSQINYYIDDSKFSFSNNNHGLRIREKEGKFELTLKNKINDNYLEINQKITEKDKENLTKPGYFPHGEIYDFLVNELSINPLNLYIICELKTTRLDIEYKGTTISLDKNEYLGEIDYDIECEANKNSDVKDTLIKFLSSFNIKLKKRADTKLERALFKLKNYL